MKEELVEEALPEEDEELSTGFVSGVTAELLDINTSHGFPISDQQDLDPESEIVVSDPSDSVSKFERFAATIVPSSPATTIHPISALPSQYFESIYKWNSRFDNTFQTLLSAPSPTLLAPPLPDPPPEPTKVVILPPQLSARVHTSM
ncbi:hypothetical protein A2U01_0045741, partial [Trifolium medium]|nr:hypothetical protein [Trifolium medium]